MFDRFDRVHGGRPLSAALRLSSGVRDISRVDCLSTADRSAAFGVVSPLVERFDFRLSAVFPRALSFACAFLETTPPEALPSTAVSACPLIRASPACCLPELPHLLPLLGSATGVAAAFEAALDAAVCALDLDALVPAFAAVACAADVRGPAVVSRALRDADPATARRLLKTFLFAFSRGKDCDGDALADAFAAFARDLKKFS
jgi:hypothetical protein